VRQVGYLQRLYRDARSTEHKNHGTFGIVKTHGIINKLRPCLSVRIGIKVEKNAVLIACLILTQNYMHRSAPL